MKKIAVFLGLLLCLFVSSWGACVSGSFRGCNVQTGRLNYICGSSCNSVSEYIGDYIKDCPSTCGNLSGFSFSSSMASMCGGDAGAGCGWGGTTFGVTCIYSVRCDTQAEADSVTIAQKCATGTMVKDTVGATIFDACQNGKGLLIAFNNPITGVHNASIGYYIVTDDSADSLDEATYNHLASLACTEVSLYRGVLNGKYVYWYSTDPEPAGVVNVVRIK